MKTYYTKCGKVSFQKSSTAAVTRFEEINEHCKGCTYIEHGSTYRGGKQLPITFCQAGSKEPNHKTEYSTMMGDNATTLSILSLDMELLKEIHDYAMTLDGCLKSGWPHFHGLDREDCRKSMPLAFESNKKGKAAKKAIIEKFFSKGSEPEEDCNHCEDCKHSVDEGESVEYIKCSSKKRFVTKKQKACDNFEPKEKHLCIECLFCRRSEKATDHPFPYKCFRAAHRKEEAWYFGADSVACSNLSLNPISCINCRTDKSTCGSMYPPDYMYKVMKPCYHYTSQIPQKRYVDTKIGRLIFVRSGIGGDTFKAMYQDTGKWGGPSAHGVKSPELPWRESQEEAQADLDAYARKKGWKVYEEQENSTPACDKSQCPFHACMSDHCQLVPMIENVPNIVREMVDEVIEYCPDLERLVNIMRGGCGPVDSVKCRINQNGYCSLDTASFEDMDAEANNCGFIRVNDRYLTEKYGVPYKDFNCGNCGHHDDVNCTLTNEKRFKGARACGDFVKKEVKDLKCTKHRCPFNNDEISECCFNSITDDAHHNEMREARDEYQCKNSELLDVLSKVESMGKCEGCCYLHKSEICNRIENFRKATPETPRCGWYWNVNTNEMGDLQYKEQCPDGKYVNLQNAVEMELIKPEERHIEDSTPAPMTVFDYSSVDNETAAFLIEKANNITFIKAGTSYAIGKELKEAQYKLASHDKTKGVFIKWIESLEISSETAYNYIHTYNFVSKQFGNIENAKSFLALPQKLQYAVSKPSAPAELQKAVLDGDITSHKQYKALEEKLRVMEEAAKKAIAAAETNRDMAQEAQRKAEQAERALKQSQDEHKSKNSRHEWEVNNLNRTIQDLKSQIEQASEPAEVQKLRDELKEAQRQVEILKDELMTPVDLEPAIVEKVPEEIEKELAELRKQTSIRNDYAFVSDILNCLRIAHHDKLKNWAKETAQQNAAPKLKAIREELIDFGVLIESMIDYLDEEIRMK